MELEFALVVQINWTTQHRMDLHVLSYPRLSFIFQVLSKSVQGFRSPRGRNCPLPLLWMAFTTACATAGLQVVME